MEIQKTGNNSFYLRGKKENVVINPTEEQLKLKKFDSRIVVISEERLGGRVDNGKVIIKGPGEYEVGGVGIMGIGSGQGTTIYKINIDGIEVCYLPNLTEELNDKKIERIDEVDILIAPVNKEKLGDGKKVLDWAKKWGANYVIPYSFNNATEEVKKFLDTADAENTTPMASLKLASGEELPEGMEIVVLE